MISRLAQARRFQTAALFAAVSVLSAPLAGLLHQATVRHVACAEHGEWVEAAQLTPAELAAPAHHHSRTVAESGEPSREGGDRDLHCALADWSHARSTPAADPAQLALPARAHAAPTPVLDDRRPPAIALLHLAPKLSPPQA